MQLAVNGSSALAVLRAIRSGKCPVCDACPGTLARRDLTAPALDEGAKWTRGRLDLSAFGVAPASKQHPTHVAVPTAATRIRSPYARSTCYTRELPQGSFVDTGAGLLFSSPELLFIEMSKAMDPAALALLGYELCGTFSRDPVDPRVGDVTLDVEPVTSVARIAAYLKAYGGKLSVPRARAALSSIADNAWSPHGGGGCGLDVPACDGLWVRTGTARAQPAHFRANAGSWLAGASDASSRHSGLWINRGHQL